MGHFRNDTRPAPGEHNTRRILRLSLGRAVGCNRDLCVLRSPGPGGSGHRRPRVGPAWLARAISRSTTTQVPHPGQVTQEHTMRSAIAGL